MVQVQVQVQFILLYGKEEVDVVVDVGVDEEVGVEGEEDGDLDDEAPIIKRSEVIIHLVEVEVGGEGPAHRRVDP